MGERGVIYRPDTERRSDCFYTRLAQQFNAVVHVDETSAVEPLDVGQVRSDGGAPVTFPTAIQSLRKCDENQRH